MEDATAKLLKSKGVPDPSFVRIGLFDEKCNHPTEVYSVHDFFRDKENAVSHMVILVDVLNERKLEVIVMLAPKLLFSYPSRRETECYRVRTSRCLAAHRQNLC